MPVEVENLDRDLAAIRKKYGSKDVVHLGSEQPPVDRIPLVSPAMMRITSGGIPLGRFSRFWGGPSSAKSLMAWEVVKAAQNLRNIKFLSGLKTVYYNIEKQYDSIFTSKLGVDTDAMLVVETDIIEDLTEQTQTLLGSNHLHVWDSRSEAVPQDRLAKDPGDWDVNLEARVWKKCMGYVHNALDKDENAIIMIDHESENMKTHSTKALGGRNPEHKSSLSIHFKKTKWLYYDEDGLLTTEDKLKEKGIMGIGGQKEADGQEIIVEVNKSRVCRPLRKANMRLDLHTFKFDHTFELMDAAMYFDKQGNIAHHVKQPAIAQKSGEKSSWYSLPEGRKVQGERQLRQLIDADEELSDIIRTAMLAGN